MSPSALPVPAPAQEPEVTYQVENPANLEAATALWRQILPIMAERIGAFNYKLGIRLSPDWDQIAIGLATGVIVMCTAKRGDKLLGYQIWLLNPYLWQKGTVIAVALAANGGRKKGVDARRLALIGMNYFKTLGVHAVVASAEFDSAAMRMWEDVGLEKIECTMAKQLWPSQQPQQQPE